MESEKILNFINKQIKCHDREIENITKMKEEEKRCLSERERRNIKYLIGRKDECEIIKGYINNIKQREV